MSKNTTRLWALTAALLLATPASAMTFQIGIEVTFAAGGNPFGAVVGTTPAAGTGNVGSQVVTGVGLESLSLNPAFDAAASLALTIGTILFGHEDDIESAAFSDVPSLHWDNNVFTGLDFVVLFEISGSNAIGKAFDQEDLAQDTSVFTSTPHYWANFDDDTGVFSIGIVEGFEEFFDEEDQQTLLGVTIGQVLVSGNVFIPEPSLLVLAGAGLLGLVLVRRRSS